MAYKPQDFYFKKAKKENLAARSAFKLQELDEKFKLLRQGYSVLDLGASPGSWSQYASRKIAQGRILGIDLNPITVKVTNAVFVTGDIRDVDIEQLVTENWPGEKAQFDVVLSDMAPKTTGIKVTDQERSFELCELALATAVRFLKPQGNFVVKFFHSDSFQKLKAQIQKEFLKVEAFRPQSTRKESKEIFLVGLKKR